MPSDASPNRFINKVCSNTKSDLIEITEDKLENILSRFIANLKKAQMWLTPLSLFVSILLVVLTAEFNKNFIGISKDIWTAIFYILLISSFTWLIWSIIYSCKFSKKTRIEYIIGKIKNNQD
jgi:hypothetical protein